MAEYRGLFLGANIVALILSMCNYIYFKISIVNELVQVMLYREQGTIPCQGNTRKNKNLV